MSRRSVLAGAAAAGIGLSLSGMTAARQASAAEPVAQSIGSGKNQLAFVLSHEQFPTQQLIEFGTAAERAGFDGVWSSDHIRPWQENQGHAMFPWITLAEAVGLIRQLWAGGHVTFAGKYYAVDNMRIYDLPSEPVPIYVAGNGPKSARLAGEIGDGWITTPANLADPQLHDAFREGALSVGKNPDGMPILVEDFVVVGGEAEANEAATFWRFVPIGFQQLLYLSDPREIEARAMAELPSPWDTWRDWLVSTDPMAHVKHIQGLWDAGATHVFVHSGNQDQMRMIDFYGREVLPRLST